MATYSVHLHFSTLVMVQAQGDSPEGAIERAREETKNQAWWDEHQEELMGNLEPWEEADIAEDSEEAP